MVGKFDFDCSKAVLVTGETLTLEEVAQTAQGRKVQLSEDASERILKAYRTVKEKIDEKKPVYGITTGFGKLSNIAINQAESAQLQKNLIMSHACGVGKPFGEEVTRAIMLLRANTLAGGHSGVNLRVVETLIEMLNKGVQPVIPEKGSLGASGDLANLAHVVLVMIGMGEAVYQGEIYPGKTAMKKAGISTIELEGKDGLGLINGTQVMTALGSLHIMEAFQLMAAANIAAALTMEAMLGLINALDPRIQQVRPHAGQSVCAAEIRSLLEGSICVNRTKRVQDAYTLRCVPQVHGASLDAMNYVKQVLTVELNSVTDNPIVFPEEGDIISGGNFHGQPLALALDFLGIAVSELANISERRIERLVNPQLSGLSPFLVKQCGLNSGYMIAQYTAASLVSENKILSHPASVDSIPSSANQEDHVSMGAISARKAGDIIENVRRVLAIEMMCAAQAIELQTEKNAEKDSCKNKELHQEHKDAEDTLGKGTREAYKAIREIVPSLVTDRVVYPDIEKISELIRDPSFSENVYRAAGLRDGKESVR